MSRYFVCAGLAVCCALAAHVYPLRADPSVSTLLDDPDPVGEAQCWKYADSDCCDITAATVTRCPPGQNPSQWTCHAQVIQSDEMGVFYLSDLGSGWLEPGAYEEGVIKYCVFREAVCGLFAGTCTWEPNHSTSLCRNQLPHDYSKDCYVE